MDYHQEGEHPHGQNLHFFESNSPHFFKIILRGTIQNGKLKIPKEFARKYCISDFSGSQHWMVSLKVPSGDVWDVEMKMCDDNQLYLHRGWPEFVDFYGIRHGHFLVFKYKRRGIFHVLIFNTSASEIKYPMKSSNSNKGQEYIHLEEDHPSHSDINIQTQNKNRDPQSPAKDEVIETNSTENTTAMEDIHVVGHSKNMNKPETSNRHLEFNESRGVIDSRTYKQRLIQANRERALEMAGCFKSMKNPYFSIVMRPSYIKRTLELPAGFLVERLELRNTSTVELRTSARRSWTMRYFYKVYNKRRNCKLTSGWRGFVEDNKLMEGDVCVFEFIKRAPCWIMIQRLPSC